MAVALTRTAGDNNVLEALENSDLAVWVRESPSIFAYTLVLSLHAIGLAMVVGTNTLIALRLLGFAKGIPLGALRRLYQTIWGGFMINAVSGVLLFMPEARSMAKMPAFWGKLTFVAIGMFIAVRLKKVYLDDEAATSSGNVPAAVRKLAWASLACWYLALIVGRLTGYPELVAAWFGF
jgi:hypothetical protein